LFTRNRGLNEGKEGARRDLPILTPSMPPLCPLYAPSEPKTKKEQIRIKVYSEKCVKVTNLEKKNNSI